MFESPREIGSADYLRGYNRYHFPEHFTYEQQYEYEQGWLEAEKIEIDERETAKYLADQEWEYQQEQRYIDEEEYWENHEL